MAEKGTIPIIEDVKATVRGSIDPHDPSGVKTHIYKLILPQKPGKLIVQGMFYGLEEYDMSWDEWIDVRDLESSFRFKSFHPRHGRIEGEVLFTQPPKPVSLEIHAFSRKIRYEITIQFHGETVPEQPPETPPTPEPEPPEERFDVGKWLEYALRKILRDEEAPSCNPSNTRLLVLILATVYTATLASFNEWASILGLTPIPTVLIGEFYRLFTYMWLHAPTTETINGIVVPHAHIAFNILFLWVFGDNVECRIGHGKYLAYYLLCGIASGVGEVLWLHSIGLGFQPIIIVGASGAISGVMGMYLILFPKNHVVFLGRRLKAWNFLILWFLGQIALLFQTDITVAVAAHITGFVVGMILGGAEKYAEREIC